MDLVHSIDATKLKREKSKEAIQFALDGKWREAIPINGEILYYFPEDLEALNRLGKAYLEVGEYAQAREAFQKVLGFSPHNSIAKRNLIRLSHLPGSSSVSREGKKVIPQLFLEESGKSGITALRTTASQEALARVAAGDSVTLDVHNNTLVVKSLAIDVLGYVEPKLGSRLVRLVKQGNKYEAAVLSAGQDRISIIIRETYRDPSSLAACSFPATGSDDYRGQIRDNLLRYDLDSEPEEEAGEDPTSMWTEDGEEVPRSVRRSSVRALASVDDEGDEDE